MQEESFVNEGMENIRKTQNALNSLEMKLNQYMLKTRDATAKRFKQPPIVQSFMPAMQLDAMTSRRGSVDKSQKRSQTGTPLITTSSPMPVKTHQQDNLEAELELYKNRLTAVDGANNSMSKIEDFYQRRTVLLEQRTQQLEIRRKKVVKDKDLLARENRRLQAEIDSFKTQERIHQKKMRIQTENIQREGRIAKQLKIKQIKAEIEKQKQIQDGLKAQIQSYETSLKLMLELHKNFVSIDVQTRQKPKRRLIENKVKSKSTILKPPLNRHRECCFPSQTLIKSKSRSMLAR